jgi:hypothetical protein
MAEVKNSFLASKMNKDLDDRLIPNGEYRDARNISIGRSEDDDIGALENVLGNSRILGPGGLPLESDETLVCTGFFMDNSNNTIYQFLTNYTGLNEFSTSTMKIVRMNFDTNVYTTLVSGIFLNLVTTNIITGINLIGNLLFWTDNRNQPRKINVELANPQNISVPNYYTTEEQISVAKYAPIDAILLYKKAVVTVTTEVIPGLIFEVDDITGVEVGMTVISSSATSCDFLTVTEIDGNNITVSQETLGIKEGDVLTLLISTMTDQSDDPAWPGDPDFLEDKYIRFSYRFRFNDGEYSLMAPFTQIAFIPKQKGYFLSGNEKSAYNSTIVNWMENNVNNVELLISLPDKGSNINSSYKVAAIDILYKESNSLAVKVLETIPVTRLSTLNTNIYTYQYQSQKPYKTLPEAQTVRVYDKVPITALSQEVSGNRIIYGNFRDQHTAPLSLNYNVTVLDKQDIFTNFIEYPNHTLKQNRNYQVGFILADKYGRQSSVILSSNDVSMDNTESISFGGSTVYSPYYNNTNSPNVKCWNGNALSVLINSGISSTIDTAAGTPGLYAEIINGGGGFIIESGTVDNAGPYTYTFESLSDIEDIPYVGSYLRGEYIDFVKVETVDDTSAPIYTITTNHEINGVYNFSTNIPDIKYAYNINPLGWYSYKIVVRQQEQEYYNVYLPGMLNGYPTLQTYGSQVVYTGEGVTAKSTLNNGINTTEFPTTEVNKTAHIVLLNDNINKIPRDLVEVGPDQKQYRSSVELYGKVENTFIRIPLVGAITGTMVNTTSFTYDVTVDYEAKEAKAGDAVFCTEAVASWYKNTTIVSNTIVGTVGTIVFTPANPFESSFESFVVTQGSNKQYYPPKKSDLASTIANATDLNFLLNTVNNITGSAAINFYQLDTNPIVARISTTNAIGVVAADMVPFLSVYETKPVSSLLDLFWETTSTGLIADINADINTGFNGPARLSKGINFEFKENQDPNGGGSGTGDANSPYITDTFFPLTSEGSVVIGITNATLAVINGNNTIVTTNFALEPSGVGGYRVRIVDSGVPFIYGSNSNLRNYVFSITFVYEGADIILPFDGVLTNVAPTFDLDCGAGDYDVTISKNDTDILIFTGENGSFSGSNSELHWSIYAGNDNVPPYFAINPTTGALTRTTAQIPANQTFVLGIRVTDAWDITTGAAAIGGLFTDCTATIKTWAAPVPANLRNKITSTNLLAMIDGIGGLHFKEGDSYGLFYVAPKVIEPAQPTPTSAAYGSPSTPRIGAPKSPRGENFSNEYQICENMEIKGGATASSLTGLTSGALLWTVNLTGQAQPSSIPRPCFYEQPPANSRYVEGIVDILLYWRPMNSITADSDSWKLITDYNNVQEVSPGISAPNWETANPNIKPYVKISVSNPAVFYPTRPSSGASSVSFITTSDTPIQWAVAVKVHKFTNCDNYPYDGNYFRNEMIVNVSCEDANFTYPPIIGPQRPVMEFFTGMESPSGYPSGVPFLTQDATVHDAIFNKIVLENVVSSTTIELVPITGSIPFAPGMVVTGPSIGLPYPVISEINVDDNPNKIKVNIAQTIPNGEELTFTSVFTVPKGKVYSPMVDAAGINVRQFYTDFGCLLPWNPPVAGSYYVFTTLAKTYQTGTGGSDWMPKVPNDPYFSARFNANGQVYDSTTEKYTSQSGWSHIPAQPGEPLKTGRNITQRNGNL